MHVALTDDQLRIRAETRAYFGELLGDGKRAAFDAEVATGVEAGPEYRALIRQMGKDGWLAVGWPVEFGGRGYGPVEQLIFLEETQRAKAPYPFVTLSTVGPALMAHGSEAQKQRFLPGIAAGEIHFAIGYTEAGSGTDLASLCAAHRVPHLRVSSRPELEQALASPNGGIEVVEAVVDRAGRRELDAAIRALATDPGQ